MALLTTSLFEKGGTEGDLTMPELANAVKSSLSLLCQRREPTKYIVWKRQARLIWRLSKQCAGHYWDREEFLALQISPNPSFLKRGIHAETLFAERRVFGVHSLLIQNSRLLDAAMEMILLSLGSCTE
jgi:hypothetical protein